MKFNLLTIVILIPLLGGCQQPNREKEAMQLAEGAMKTFGRHSNVDSTNRALYLIDSSLKLYKSPKLYFCKYQIFTSNDDQLSALHVCDTVLMLDKDNFAFTLEKGCTLEKLGRLDSAFSYYRVALDLINNPHSFNGTEIGIDYERIVITGLLKDTASFNKLVNEFRDKYKGSNDPYFQVYSQQLDNFRREDYVN